MRPRCVRIYTCVCMCVYQWAAKHKSCLVGSTTILNDNIHFESNRAALIDAANLLFKDNCSIFEAERILFHCFIPQAQKYNKVIKVLLMNTKHVQYTCVRSFLSLSLRLSLSLSFFCVYHKEIQKQKYACTDNL